jgi:hypothetical protein
MPVLQILLLIAVTGLLIADIVVTRRAAKAALEFLDETRRLANELERLR